MTTTTVDAVGMAESDWEVFALEQLAELGWTVNSGHDIAPGSGERESWEDLHIPGRMFDALRRLNPDVPNEYLQQALVEIVAPASNDAITENYRVHGWLTSGFRGITYIDDLGQERTPTLRLISTDRSAQAFRRRQLSLRLRQSGRRKSRAPRSPDAGGDAAARNPDHGTVIPAEAGRAGGGGPRS